MSRLFTVDEARALMPRVLEATDELIALRADLHQLAHDLRTGEESPLGGQPEAKGFEARISEILENLNALEVEVKGLAPVLLDFPAEFDGQSVRLCWLEGERELGWYHNTELGFAGRRKLDR
ncbi:MAG: DUF2203 family protein [Pseudonocardiaceae bacterium]|nr:DUF2203 family protein [Pseudonocardiaceae bacterium]